MSVPIAKPFVWTPPGADVSGDEQRTFGENCDEAAEVPARLADKSSEMVESVNDWHYAMINDHPRNEFFRAALEHAVTPESVVLEIGTGSGLLSIIAASLGARHVIAVEANGHLAQLARNIIDANGYSERVTVVHKMSTELELTDLPNGQKADVLVSEILGTLMLGESALEYVADARERLVKPNAIMIPDRGCQYAQLVCAPEVEALTKVSSWRDIDLSLFNTLQDTVSMVFTKQYGFRFSSIDHQFLSEPIPVAQIDFTTASPGVLGELSRINLKAAASGPVHAVLCYWEVFAPGVPFKMSTNPQDTKGNFPRDMQWGQALQLIEDITETSMTDPLHTPERLWVDDGEELELHTRWSEDSAVMSFQVHRAGR